MRRVITILKFILLGPFILILSIPVNGFVFFYNMYTKAHDADDRVDERIFTKESLETFQLCCDKTLKQMRKQSGDMKTNQVQFVQLNKNLQFDLNINEKIRGLIYDNASSDKFLYDAHTKKSYLNPKWLSPIKEFNSFKKLVFNCADKTAMINIDKVKSLIE